MSGIYVDRPYLMSKRCLAAICIVYQKMVCATCQMGGRGGRPQTPSSRPQGGKGDYYSRHVRRQDTLINKKILSPAFSSYLLFFIYTQVCTYIVLKRFCCTNNNIGQFALGLLSVCHSNSNFNTVILDYDMTSKNFIQSS